MRYLLLIFPMILAAQEPRVEKNVVFGMYSGLALLMDVHRPAQSNGHALVVVPGSGWTSKLGYDAPPLTALPSAVQVFVPKLLDAGYTLRRESSQWPSFPIPSSSRGRPTRGAIYQIQRGRIRNQPPPNWSSGNLFRRTPIGPSGRSRWER